MKCELDWKDREREWSVSCTGKTGREMGVLAALDRQGERSGCELDWRDRERE